MFTLYDIILWSVPLAVLYMWWRGMGQKDQVMQFTRKYCQDRGYQLLDQSLVFRGYRFVRQHPGKPRLLCRQYVFDVSTTGSDRYSGEVSISRGRIIRVLLNTDHKEITDYT